MHKATVAALFALLAVHAGAAVVEVGFGEGIGPVKPVNGVGQPPMIDALGSWSMMHYLKEAGIPYSRLHDVGGWLGGGLYVDIPNLFPDFDADENDPGSYRFVYTDSLIKALVENGVEPFFRLGVTIENFVEKGYPPVNSLPPKDYAKWARVAEHVIRHYTEGWADGFRYKISYWEIWNEPENLPEPEKNPMWRGTFEEYMRFYGIVAPHLKAKFPHLKIGGYGSCGFYAGVGSERVAAANSSPRMRYFVDCAEKFLAAARDNGWPLDFFSFHSYSSPNEAMRQVRFADELLSRYGFGPDKCERIFNEWLPSPWLGVLGTAKQAADVAAELIALQNGPCDIACIYDARCSHGQYSPLFNPLTQKPHKSYYAFTAFNELRKIGSAVRCTSSDPAVYAAAAAGNGRFALMVANPSGRDVEVEFKGLPAECACRIADAERTDETVPVPKMLPAHSFVVITGALHQASHDASHANPRAAGRTIEVLLEETERIALTKNTQSKISASKGGREDGLFGAVVDARYGKDVRDEILADAERAFRTHFDDDKDRKAENVVWHDGPDGKKIPYLDGWISPEMGAWQGEFWGKYMLAGAEVAESRNDDELKQWLAENAIRFVREFRQSDGYICSYADRSFLGGPKDPRHDFAWNIWGRKYTMWALLEIARVCSQPELVEVVAGMADQMIAQLSKSGLALRETGAFAGMPSCSILIVYVRLYRATGRREYLDFARSIVADWDRADGAIPNLVGNAFSGRPVHDWYPKPELWAKSYEMMSCLEGIVEYAETVGGAEGARLLDAVTRVRDLLVRHETNRLGSVGDGDKFTGRQNEYNNGTELCDVVYWMRLNAALRRATGDGKAAALIEKAFRGAFLPGIRDGGRWCVQLVKADGTDVPAPLQVDMKRHHCCVDNMPRGFVTASQ